MLLHLCYDTAHLKDVLALAHVVRVHVRRAVLQRLVQRCAGQSMRIVEAAATTAGEFTLAVSWMRIHVAARRAEALIHCIADDWIAQAAKRAFCAPPRGLYSTRYISRTLLYGTDARLRTGMLFAQSGGGAWRLIGRA